MGAARTVAAGPRGLSPQHRRSSRGSRILSKKPTLSWLHAGDQLWALSRRGRTQGSGKRNPESGSPENLAGSGLTERRPLQGRRHQGGFWPTVGELRPEFANAGQCCPKSANSGPSLTKSLPVLVESGQSLVSIGRSLANIRQHWSKVARCWPKLARIGRSIAQLVQCGLNLGRISTPETTGRPLLVSPHSSDEQTLRSRCWVKRSEFRRHGPISLVCVGGETAKPKVFPRMRPRSAARKQAGGRSLSTGGSPDRPAVVHPAQTPLTTRAGPRRPREWRLRSSVARATIIAIAERLAPWRALLNAQNVAPT